MLKDRIRKAEETLDKTKLQIKERFGLFDPVIIYPFRGYGNENAAYLNGRILEKEDVIHSEHDLEGGIWHNLRKAWKRYESDEVPGVHIKGELYGYTAETVSDEDGYFRLEFSGLGDRNLKNGWHDVRLQITSMPFDIEYEAEAVGEVLISDQKNSFGIISDVDDTIIESNATNAIKRISTLVRHSAKTRTVFEGVDELYHGLIQHDKNPLFFVSGSSYNLYDLLTNFCDHHHIPKAPFLLRDLGLNAKQWLKQDTTTYKLEHIRTLLNIFPKLSFICIGDSGQKDAHIYKTVHEEYPGRVKAIYIRHVNSHEDKKELEKIQENLDIPFLLMDHSSTAMEHARANGWME